MALKTEADIFVAARSQAYMNLNESAIIKIVPHIYFTVENVEDFLVEKLQDHNNLNLAMNLVQILDEFACIDLSQLWYDSVAEIKDRLLSSSPQLAKKYDYNDFEAQCMLEVKVKLVMQQLQHILNEDWSDHCTLFRCCSILESPVIIDEMVAFISAIVVGLSKEHILPEVIAGLSVHSSTMARTLIARLILNFPQNWPEISEKLLGQSSPSNSTTQIQISSRILSVLYIGIGFTPDIITILNHCIPARQHPELVMDLALRLCRNSRDFLMLDFFKRMFFDEGQLTRTWFSNHLKLAWEMNPSVAAEVNAVLLSAGVNISNDPKAAIPKEKLITALKFLRVIAALRGFTSFSLSPDLRAFVLRMLIRPSGRNERAVNFTCYSVAFVIGLRSCLIDHSCMGPEATAINAETEELLVAWLRRLLNQPHHFHVSQRQSSSYSELLILLALLFKNNQQTAIRDIVASILEVDAPCLMRNVSSSRKLFAQKVFTEQLITTQAAQVPVTAKLNARMTGNLPIHCVHQLLKNHAFIKNRVQIKGWIYRQILESVRPLHPLIPDLLETYAGNILASSTSSPSSIPGLFDVVANASIGGCTPFSEEELMSQFTVGAMGLLAAFCAPNYESFNFVCSQDEQRDLTPQLLFLYYMFYIYDQELISRVSDVNNQHRYQSKPAVSLLSDRLWDCIPITYLLRYARSHLRDYGKLYPRLLQFATNRMPHLTIGEFIIQDELLLDPFWVATYNCRSSERPRSFPVSTPDELNAGRNIVATRTCCAVLAPLMCNFKGMPLQWLLEENVDEEFLLASRFTIFDRALAADATPARREELIVAVNRVAEATLTMDKFASSQSLLLNAEAIGTRMPRALLESAALSGNRRFTAACCSLWRRLHSIMPQRMEVMTIRALSSRSPAFMLELLTHHDLVADPVEKVLMGIDQRVFRCPPLLRILLRILECSLLASRSQWMHRITDRFLLSATISERSSSQDKQSHHQPLASLQQPPSLVPIISPDVDQQLQSQQHSLPKGFTKRKKSQSPSSSSAGAQMATTEEKQAAAPTTATSPGEGVGSAGGPLASSEECERLRMALVTSQDATVVQLLLELCLPSKEEQALNSEVTALREIHGIVCTFINYLFVAEPNLARVVFWQTFPRSLIPIVVREIPSLHIYVDSVIEIFRKRGDFEHMVFCLDFVSHIAMHYSVEALLDRLTFFVESMHHIFTCVLSVEELPTLLLACGPALCRLGCAFPNLSARIAATFISALSTLAAAAAVNSDNVDGLLFRLRRQFLALPSAESPVIRKEMELSGNEMDVADDELPDMSRLTSAHQIQLACSKTMSLFDRLVCLTCGQRRLYLPPSIEEIP